MLLPISILNKKEQQKISKNKNISQPSTVITLKSSLLSHIIGSYPSPDLFQQAKHFTTFPQLQD